MRSVYVAFVVLVVSTPLCQSARLLSGHFNDDIGDPSGYSAQAMARSMDAASSKNRQAITPFDAEATANSAFSGVYRAASDVHRATYATVEADPIGNNPDRRRETIQPRARSAQDVVGSKVINQASGSAQLPGLLMGGASVAMTYEGATAAAASDALMVNQGRGKTTISNSLLTASTGTLKPASRAASVGMTAQPASAMALSGMANGKIELAQADQAVAIAMREKKSAMEKRWDTTASGSMH